MKVGLSTVVLVVSYLAMLCSVAAQSDLGTRKIAPDRFPEYRQSEPSADQSFTVVAPSPEAPTGACDRKLPRPTWLRCLRDTVELTNRRVDEVAEKVRGAIR